MSDNYYRVLGVAQNADSNEIKKAYRAKARKFHPDLNTTEGSDQLFMVIQEAYEVLSDSDKRKEYNKTLTKSKPKKTKESNNKQYSEVQPKRRASKTYTYAEPSSQRPGVEPQYEYTWQTKVLIGLQKARGVIRVIMGAFLFFILPGIIAYSTKRSDLLIVMITYYVLVAILIHALPYLYLAANLGLIYLMFVGLSQKIFWYIPLALLGFVVAYILMYFFETDI